MGVYSGYPNSIYNDGAGGGGGGDVGTPYLKNIMPTTAVKVVDENGYIGGDFFGVYYPNINYFNNFAIVIPGADYSGLGLGTVTFVDTTTTIGGRVYRTVTIGGVTWLAENLDYKFSGCGIGGGGLPSTPNAWYYNNDEATYGIDGIRKCGLLYNGYAVKLLNDNRNELIPGWHVSTIDDWNTLANAVGGNAVAGTILKAIDGVIGGNWPDSWGGADADEFGILPAGQYSANDSDFADVGNYSAFWTSSTTGVQDYYLYFNPSAAINQGFHGKSWGLSVRLVKD